MGPTILAPFIGLRRTSNIDEVEDPRTNRTESRTSVDSQDSLTSFQAILDHVPLEDADERLKKGFRDYVKQKGRGKGFTDWALLIANANQLHFVVTHPDAHLRTLETLFLSLSIIFQVIAHMLLIIEFNINEWRDLDRFKDCRNFDTAIMCLTFFIIVLNIMVVAFGGPGLDIKP